MNPTRSSLLPLVAPLALIAAAALGPASSARAGGTEVHDVSSFSDFDAGEVEGAAIEASGKLTLGYASAKAEISHSTTFSCLVDGKQAWVGTADKATIQRVDLRGDTPVVEELAALEGVVVSAMARLPGGDLVAATLPGGKLVRVDKKGEVSDFAELKDVEQIWALVPHEGRLLVATGPRGELWAVGLDGKDPKVVLDVPEKNLLSVLAVGDEVLVGTSPKARLYQLVEGNPEGVLIHDFEGDELRAMALSGASLVAAVNEFEDRSVSSRVALTKQLNRASLTGDKPVDNNTSRARADADTALWAVDLGERRDLQRAQDAAWDRWLTKKGQYFIDLVALDDRGTVLAASSEGGKIYRARGRRDVAVIADFEERQATSLCALKEGEVLATAGDGSAVYTLGQAPAKSARWVSDVLDAKQPARYGTFALRGKGTLQLRVRTGPGDEVDERWSDWRKVELGRENDELRGSADLPRRRYMQVEVGLASADAELRELTAFYGPENLAPMLEEVGVKAPKVSASSDTESKAELTLEWDSDARDGDDLSYEVWIRSTGAGTGKGKSGGKEGAWISLTPDGPISKTELELDLDTLADGLYEAKVRVSDEPANGSAAATFDELVSDPFVIDRTRPSLVDIEVVGGRITGVASDVGSYIHDVAYAVDGKDFRPASASDGLFDGGREGFEVVLPTLDAGAHRVVIRARDARGNIDTAALEVSGG
ncbi:hypothetical protein G6O69_04525 [Pseudenhygromyxa sp. WMMC2535]|uniref:hypothetical protein n=1 Tax=Pseudenhygromyxa sp. WMMC2535 TaxID=2712867 RepID=UPI001554B3E9|nr:hypothetical protein [Pseudenhygromyxa sp. WMMC2535]NVB37083.1 hypothetical protein [Pseudenhygromyxa sp. WMMC2535]